MDFLNFLNPPENVSTPIDQNASELSDVLANTNETLESLDNTLNSVNRILNLVFSFLNPGTTKEAIEHFTQILKTLVYIVSIFVGGLLAFVVGGALKVFLPMRYTITFLVFLVSLVGIFVGLLLLAKIYVLDTLDSSGQELAQAVSENANIDNNVSYF